MQANKNMQNILQIFLCEKCDYKCSKKSSWTQHLLTAKHTKANFGLMQANEKYVCEKSVQIEADVDPTCDFNCRKNIMSQPISSEQFSKLISAGATDVLEGFISKFSKKSFKARLIWDAEDGKVSVDFMND